MPLTHDVAPAAANKLIGAAIAEFAGHGAIALARGAEPAASAPVRLYHLGADAIASGQGLSAAIPVGWIATVHNGPETVGSVELADAPMKRGRGLAAASGLKFSSFTTGPLHRGLGAEMSAAAARHTRAMAHVAIVRAPAVHLLAVWTSSGGTDTLTPIAPAPPPLEAGKPMEASAALALLAGTARSALESDKGRS